MTPTPAAPVQYSFSCSICAESSERICAFCTKDACENHLCARCSRCSDCCVCEMRRQSGGVN